MKQAEKIPFGSLRIFFTGVGGQGTLLATRLVGEAALEADIPVVMSEIHGMAQRGGVVESTIVVGEWQSPIIADGDADVLLAFEPLEALRALPKCHSQSWVIVNTVSSIPFTVATGQGRYPDKEEIYRLIASEVKQMISCNAVELAREAGTERAANVVLVGAFAGTGLLPIDVMFWHQAIEKIVPARFHDVNLEAFSIGYEKGSAYRSS